MTLMDIIYKIALFFAIFYGAIGITSLISKKIREKQTTKEEKSEE